MKFFPPALLALLIIISCNSETKTSPDKPISDPLVGTWRLLDGTLVEKGDTVVTDYTRRLSCIKIITPTHFSFLQHDLTKGADSAVFVAGGGKYSLKDGLYTEHLEYCSARAWEGHNFSFTMTFKNDTLVQQGIEKIEAQGIDRLNIERYVRFTSNPTKP